MMIWTQGLGFFKQCGLAILLLLSVPVWADHIHVQDGVIMQPLPGKTKSSGYFTIHNAQSYDVYLRSVSATFARIEMHETQVDNGRARMVRYEEVLIPAGSRVVFERGGKHLMLFGLPSNLADTLTLEFVMSDGSQFQTTFSLAQW